MLKFNELQRIITLVLLVTFGAISYADMPRVSCESQCPNAPIQFKNNQPMPFGAHCTQLKQNNMYYRMMGKGKPTIIFSSGTGFPSEGWYEAGIANAIAKKVRVFTYDRIYTFNSCPNSNNYMPITAEDVVMQLRELLKQENIQPPYILVGHSMGGLYMQLYARKFPHEVAGLILMDASSDAGPTPMPIAAVKMLQSLGNPQNPTPENPLYNEMIGQLPSYLQMKSAPPLPKDMPLIVMYATKHCLPKVWTKEVSMCMSKSQEAAHESRQLEMYNMSQIHKLIRIDGSHNSFFEQAKNPLVMDALNSMLQMSQPRVKKLSKKLV